MDRDTVINRMETICEICKENKWMTEFTSDVIYPVLSDALFLLKEQETVKPYIDIDEAKCPICKVKLTRQELLGDGVLFEDFYDYCPHCGRTVNWNA